MRKTFAAGIVGCGKIATDFADDPKMKGDIFTHAEAYSTCGGTELRAICDLDSRQLEKCGERWHVPARYLILEEMICKERLDIVSVCTPDSSHYEVIKGILTGPNRVSALLCEKPLATSLIEAEELVNLAHKYKVVLSVMYMRRFAKNFQALKDLISTGDLGEIQAIFGWYTKGVRHNGTHWFDTLRYLVGEVEWVMAWNRLNDIPGDPTLDVMLGVEGGCIASLRACDEEAFTIFEMDIIGTYGRVRVVDSGFKMEYFQAADSERYSGYRELSYQPKYFGDRRNLMLHAVEDLVNVLSTGSQASCTGEDGVAALSISEAAIESAATGNKVIII